MKTGNDNQSLLSNFCFSSLGRVTVLSKRTKYLSHLTQTIMEVGGCTDNGTLGDTHAGPTQVTTVLRMRTMHRT